MIRAIAFHKMLALEKLHEYFAGESAQFAAGASGTKCKKCNLAFTVVLPMKDNPQNSGYVQWLQNMISRDCIKGMHRDEYVLEAVSKNIR